MPIAISPRFDDLPEDEKLDVLAAVARAALGRYDIDPSAAIRLVNLSENATYRVGAPAAGRSWALRVHRDGYHSRAGIASELAWVTALRQDGVAVTPVPVPGRDGALIQSVSHAALPRPRCVVLFDWEAGNEPSADADLGDAFATLGETAARMHDHTRRWRRPAGFERPVWDFDTSLGARPHWGRWRDGMGMDATRAALFGRAVATIGDRLRRFGQGPDRFGLIHADMRLANLLIDGDTVKVLDFDDCGFSWHLYDAATAVSFFEDRADVPALTASWAEGYRRVRPLPAEDEAEIPTFILLRRILLVAWIGSHADTDLARSMGVAYTEATVALCEAYLTRFG